MWGWHPGSVLLAGLPGAERLPSPLLALADVCHQGSSLQEPFAAQPREAGGGNEMG